MRNGHDEPGYRLGYSDGAFDAGLDAYQAREREMAAQREAQGEEEAKRPHAERFATTFGCLRLGDFMTAEPERGADARWVEVVEWEVREDGKVHLTFATPQPIGVGMHQRWCLTREKDDAVVIDMSARAEG